MAPMMIGTHTISIIMLALPITIMAVMNLRPVMTAPLAFTVLLPSH